MIRSSSIASCSIRGAGISDEKFHRTRHLFIRQQTAVMREWQKPTIDETESGMEVTSYLPARESRTDGLNP
jgi:coenzyme PQQ precursor peptide PqqA